MDDNFSSRVKDVISYSKEEALRLGHKQIGTEHLLTWYVKRWWRESYFNIKFYRS